MAIKFNRGISKKPKMGQLKNNYPLLINHKNKSFLFLPSKQETTYISHFFFLLLNYNIRKKD